MLVKHDNKADWEKEMRRQFRHQGPGCQFLLKAVIDSCWIKTLYGPTIKHTVVNVPVETFSQPWDVSLPLSTWCFQQVSQGNSRYLSASEFKRSLLCCDGFQIRTELPSSTSVQLLQPRWRNNFYYFFFFLNQKLIGAITSRFKKKYV